MSFVTLANLLGSVTSSKWSASSLVNWRNLSFRERWTDRQTDRETSKQNMSEDNNRWWHHFAAVFCFKPSLAEDNNRWWHYFAAVFCFKPSLAEDNNRWWHYFAAVFCFKPSLAVSNALCLTRLDIVLSWTSGICQSSWWLRERLLDWHCSVVRHICH